jgi:hypothetical protein
MNITVRIEKSYGVERIYPVCEKAKTFASMVKQETLTKRDIEHIKKLGFEIIVSQPEVRL